MGFTLKLSYAMPLLRWNPLFFSAARQGQAEIFQGQHSHKWNLGIQSCGFSWLYEIRVPIKLFLKVHPNCLAFYLLPLSSLAVHLTHRYSWTLLTYRRCTHKSNQLVVNYAGFGMLKLGLDVYMKKTHPLCRMQTTLAVESLCRFLSS